MSLLKPEQYRDTSGQIYTIAMVYEFNYDHDRACVTLKEDDHVLPSGKRLISIPRVYLQYCINDPTEYDFAIALFGSWPVWQRVSTSPKWKEPLAALRKEAEVARKSHAFKTLVQEANDETSKGRAAAAKYLIEEPWKKGTNSADGRAKRAQVRESAQEAFERSGIEDDLQRLREEGHIN